MQRVDKNGIIVNLGRAEAILPPREQIPREIYRQGDRIRGYVLEVKKISKGPQIVLSRTHPNFLIQLFQTEVPEIAEGTVSIINAVREPGSRAKIAVVSKHPDVDPVGACVGVKGARVQSVVQELRGEKIDIIPWNMDPAKFVVNALAPAVISKVIIDQANRSMEVIVPDDQLSLAIGKRGQNVRLASKLTNWRIDVKSETRYERQKQAGYQSLLEVSGLTEDSNSGSTSARLTGRLRRRLGRRLDWRLHPQQPGPQPRWTELARTRAAQAVFAGVVAPAIPNQTSIPILCRIEWARVRNPT